jgi:hypothetical protein
LVEQARRLLRFGVLLVLFALLIGLAIPALAVPRLGVASTSTAWWVGLPSSSWGCCGRTSGSVRGPWRGLLARALLVLRGHTHAAARRRVGGGRHHSSSCGGNGPRHPVQEAILSAGLVTAGVAVFVLFVLLYLGLRRSGGPE